MARQLRRQSVAKLKHILDYQSPLLGQDLMDTLPPLDMKIQTTPP